MTDQVCKACGGEDLRAFYEVKRLPVHSCLMVDTREKALSFPMGRLELAVCRSCGFIQNNAYDAGLQNYSPDYEETQAFSPRFQRFLAEICDDQIAKYNLADKTALEIGCGKGEFLVELCELAPCSGIGIDPGYRPDRTTASVAERITFIQDFYGPKYEYLKADYVCCRHTLEHIADVEAFMRLVRISIGDRLDVPVFFELPDMERVLVERAFWDIYYEHCTYFTMGSLARLFRRTGFDVHDLWKAYDGQYVMLEARPSPGPTDPRLAEEEDLARTLAQVDGFETTVRSDLERLRGDVDRWESQNKKIALWGSGSKAVSYLTTLNLGDEIDAVVDINPHKHGKFLAGTGHEITSPQSLKQLQPDVVIAMNPIYREEIGRDLAAMELGALLTAL